MFCHFTLAVKLTIDLVAENQEGGLGEILHGKDCKTCCQRMMLVFRMCVTYEHRAQPCSR